MLQSNDLSRSVAALNQDSTLVVVIEMSQTSWLVTEMVPGIARQPLKKLAPDEDGLLKLVHRWRDEATLAGCKIERVAGLSSKSDRNEVEFAEVGRERTTCNTMIIIAESTQTRSK